MNETREEPTMEETTTPAPASASSALLCGVARVDEFMAEVAKYSAPEVLSACRAVWGQLRDHPFGTVPLAALGPDGTMMLSWDDGERYAELEWVGGDRWEAFWLTRGNDPGEAEGRAGEPLPAEFVQFINTVEPAT
jgi:hypothetical protein